MPTANRLDMARLVSSVRRFFGLPGKAVLTRIGQTVTGRIGNAEPAGAAILPALKKTILREMNEAAGRGLYVPRISEPEEIAKLPAGLVRFRLKHELEAADPRWEVLNVNFVFEKTIPRLYEKGVFSTMGLAEAEAVIKTLVDFASQAVLRSHNLRDMGLDHQDYYKKIELFFLDDLIKYADWIKRKGEIQEIVLFKAGIRSEDDGKRILAIRRAAEVGMAEAEEDLLHILRTGSDKEKLAAIESLQTLGKRDTLLRELEILYPGITGGINFTRISKNVKEVKPRGYHGMAASEDGRIYVCGGNDGDKNLNDLFIYDPPNKKWIDLTNNIPVHLRQHLLRFNQIVKGTDGEMYLYVPISGINDPDWGGQEWKLFWAYDPKTGEFQSLGLFLPDGFNPFDHFQFAMGKDKKIYMVSYRLDDNNPTMGDYGGFRNIVFHAYDTQSRKIEVLTDRAVAIKNRKMEIAAGSDGRIYLFGGAESEPLKDFWAYDPVKGEFTDLSEGVPKELKPRVDHSVVASPDGKIFVFGGTTARQSSGKLLKDLWMYDISTENWTNLSSEVPADLSPRSSHRMVAAPDGTMYVFGGNVNSGGVQIPHQTSMPSDLDLTGELWKIRISPASNSKDAIEEVKKQLRAGK